MPSDLDTDRLHEMVADYEAGWMAPLEREAQELALEVLSLRAEVERLKTEVRRYLVACGPHIAPSWRAGLEEALGERVFLGLRDREVTDGR